MIFVTWINWSEPWSTSCVSTSPILIISSLLVFTVNSNSWSFREVYRRLPSKMCFFFRGSIWWTMAFLSLMLSSCKDTLLFWTPMKWQGCKNSKHAYSHTHTQTCLKSYTHGWVECHLILVKRLLIRDRKSEVVSHQVARLTSSASWWCKILRSQY